MYRPIRLILIALFPLQLQAEPILPPLFHQSGDLSAEAGAASVPLPPDWPREYSDALERGEVSFAGKRVQAQTVAYWGDEESPRRVLVRWTGRMTREALEGNLAPNPGGPSDAGWHFTYRMVEGNTGERNWIMGLRDIPLEKTEYEMYQLNLHRLKSRVGVRLGLRHNNRIYWWQFVRAEFLQRGPVFDVLRAGGPIYNEETTLQADLYLVLYANGVIEACAHFATHMREGEGLDVRGVPVIAFDVPRSPKMDVALTGKESHFDLGGAKLNLGLSTHYADGERPGSLKTEDGIVVWQPWLDQQIFGGNLVDPTGIPEHRILRHDGATAALASKDNLGQADQFYVVTVGDKLLPSGVARSVPFTFSVGAASAEVVRLQAPGWWHAQTAALPLGNLLPVRWWAIPQALVAGEASWFAQQTLTGPFEHGRRSADGDGTLAAAMLALGSALSRTDYCREALAPAYWRADIPIHHVDFKIREIPYFGWQWIVQPYSVWLGALAGYWETGDPYLLETSQFAADSYYRFFWTNRPHRFVGRDTLPVFDLIAMHQTTGEKFYLNRVRKILAEARATYSQTDAYWPGHQSGCGSNGVARRDQYDYIPMVLAGIHVDFLEEMARFPVEKLPEEEEHEMWRFIRFMVELTRDKGGVLKDWIPYRMALQYRVMAALMERFPEEREEWSRLLAKWNEEFELPTRHSGAKAFTWTCGALRFDAMAWNPVWVNGALRLAPNRILLETKGAPKTAIIETPLGDVQVAYEDGEVSVMGAAPCKVVVQ
ncbi:MAG: hypothetical protein HUU16_10940 [Candidatus Omnitrophica bacterium]|nr:hypothetical protein [Candidatus Omnitrophota bacterium]